MTAGRIVRELWWTSQKFFSAGMIISPWFSVSICRQGDEKLAHWWLQFRDILSPQTWPFNQSINVQNSLNLTILASSYPRRPTSSLLNASLMVPIKLLKHVPVTCAAAWKGVREEAKEQHRVVPNTALQNVGF
jgi:hypothetical protein